MTNPRLRAVFFRLVVRAANFVSGCKIIAGMTYAETWAMAANRAR
jgi:hypothetical protein